MTVRARGSRSEVRAGGKRRALDLAVPRQVTAILTRAPSLRRASVVILGELDVPTVEAVLAAVHRDVAVVMAIRIDDGEEVASPPAVDAHDVGRSLHSGNHTEAATVGEREAIRRDGEMRQFAGTAR